MLITDRQTGASRTTVIAATSAEAAIASAQNAGWLVTGGAELVQPDPTAAMQSAVFWAVLKAGAVLILGVNLLWLLIWIAASNIM